MNLILLIGPTSNAFAGDHLRFFHFSLYSVHTVNFLSKSSMLMEAVGEPVCIHNSNPSSIEDLLKKFAVGTE